MKISVIIPTSNRPELLLRCLAALTAQQFNRAEFEVIVAIDGPDTATEHSMRRIRNDDRLLKCTRLYEQKGPAAARNRGWLIAKGELIAFTDDDCIPDPGWLSGLWAAYQAGGTADVAFAGRIVVPLDAGRNDHALNTANLENARFVTANCACTKSALLKAGGFDEQFRLAWREDSDLEFKLIEQQIPIVKVPDAQVVHPVRSAPWDISLREQRKGMYNALLYKKYPALYKDKIGQSAPVSYYVANVSLAGAAIALLAGAPLSASVGMFVFLGSAVRLAYLRMRRLKPSWGIFGQLFATSLLIPTLSVYWQWYGAWKFRVFFI